MGKGICALILMLVSVTSIADVPHRSCDQATFPAVVEKMYCGGSGDRARLYTEDEVIEINAMSRELAADLAYSNIRGCYLDSIMYLRVGQMKEELEMSEEEILSELSEISDITSVVETVFSADEHYYNVSVQFYDDCVKKHRDQLQEFLKFQ